MKTEGKIAVVLIIGAAIALFFYYTKKTTGVTPGLNLGVNLGGTPGFQGQPNDPALYFGTGGNPVFSSIPGLNSEIINKFSPKINVNMSQPGQYGFTTINSSYMPLFGMVGYSAYGTY